MYLNLGCGPVRLIHPQHKILMQDYAPFEQWTLVDLYAKEPDFDLHEASKPQNESIQTWDATTLLEVPDGSCKVIYSSHLLEHFPHPTIPQILQVWYTKLLPGGTVVVNVPDLAWVCKEVVKYTKGDLLQGYYDTFAGEHGLLSIIYGSESHAGEYHKGGFTKAYLERLLAEVGFVDISVEQVFDAHDMQVLLAKGKKA